MSGGLRRRLRRTTSDDDVAPGDVAPGDIPTDDIPASDLAPGDIPPDDVAPGDAPADPDSTTERPVVADAPAGAADAVPARSRRRRRPLYHRLLRLRHIAPTAWQRAAFADLPFALAVLLVLADLATAWTLLVLPLAVAAVVKGHDLLAGLLAPAPPGEEQTGPQTQNGAAPAGDGAVGSAKS